MIFTAHEYEENKKIPMHFLCTIDYYLDEIFLQSKNQKNHNNARDGIRTQELLRDQALNLTPLTWLGYPRACIHYI